MNLLNLGAVCYKRFNCSKVVESLLKIDGMFKIQSRQLNSDQVIKAKERAQARLRAYYSHLETLLQSVSHSRQQDALKTISALAKDDGRRIDSTYDSLAGGNDEITRPGIAIFLHVGNRSFALLPEIDGNSPTSQEGPVYMAPRWSETIFGPNDEITGNDLRLRILRSNRLWQRERWSVVPATNTVEPTGEKGAAFFNNIMLHDKPVDGWVDAFWGVQSGVRIPIPVNDGAGSQVILLLANYVPDAFEDWDRQPNEYVKPMPDGLAQSAIDILAQDFATELSGLSYATTLLSDVIHGETALLDSGMRVLAHYVDGERQSPENPKSTWERRIVPLVQQLRQISPRLYGEISDLERPMDTAFNRLEALAKRLPADEKTSQWRSNVLCERSNANLTAFSLLSRGCTIGDLAGALQSLQQSRQSTVTLSQEVKQRYSQVVDDSLIHPYLLTAILENLLNRHNVSLHMSIKTDLERPDKKVLQLTAFYPEWMLDTKDENDFLLKPLASLGSERTRNGFYLTAQVLWRHNGLIEYYPLCENTQPPRVALLNLSIPL